MNLDENDWKEHNRWHHYVNYRPFKYNKLMFKINLNLQNRYNDYGLKLKKVS